MSSPCTITRLVRWRVRDWASCFYACRFPLDEEPHSSYSSSSTSPYNPKKGETRSKDHNKKKTIHDDDNNNNNNSCNNQENNESSKTNYSTAEEETSESSWPHFAEEDYIVFCFKEDGAIHVIEDRRSATTSSGHINSSNGSSKPVNRKLMYIEKVEEVRDSSNGDLVNEDEKNKCPENEGELHIMDKQCSLKKFFESAHPSDNEWPPDEIKEIRHIEETNECKPGSNESSGSKLSDSSTSSFTFPVLGSEGMDSPARMPKSERLNHHMRKPKERRVLLQCCRF